MAEVVTIHQLTEIEKALKAFLKSLSDLRTLNIITNKKDFTCQIGEWLVAILFDGNRATSGIQKDWDIKIDNKYVQVKAHAKAETTTAKWSAIRYNPAAQIDELIIVVFTQDYKLKSFYKAPWRIALTLIRRNADRDIIHWKHLSEYEIPIHRLPKQDLIKFFR